MLLVINVILFISICFNVNFELTIVYYDVGYNNIDFVRAYFHVGLIGGKLLLTPRRQLTKTTTTGKMTLISSNSPAHFNGNITGKKNVPKVWSSPSFKALKNVFFFTSSKYLVEPLGRKLSLKF